MNIFYAVQATGNGHISRAMELLPHLQEYGTVDIFLSGDNSHLLLDAPVKYRSKGLSLYYNCTGGLDYWQMVKGFQPLRLRQEIKDLPVEKYDLIINDFDYITAAACAKKNIPSVNFGHQASFQSMQTPRPERVSPAGEWVLKNYARANRYVGLHFSPYDDFIFTPVIKKDILLAEPRDLGHITVYLPSYCEAQLTAIFRKFPEVEFEIFCGQTKRIRREDNISFLPVDRFLFNQSLIYCKGIITGGGFETPAEALHLGKKLMVIPIRNQYEQQCNAAALKKMGVMSLKRIDEQFGDHFVNWMNNPQNISVDFRNSVSESLSYLFGSAVEREESVMSVTNVTNVEM
jgi:uncharacterized protein (TIGR00661 family)